MQEINEYDNIKAYIALAGKYKILKPEEEIMLFRKYKTSELKEQKQIEEEFVKRNLKLVIKEAKNYVGKGVPLEDLIQEGLTGVVRAVQLFEVERGNKFSTYAVRWIRQRLGRCIENKSRLIKIPANILAKANKLKKEYRKLVEIENRPPTPEELADVLNISKEEAQQLGRYFDPHTSLNDSVGEDDNLSLVNFIEDTGMNPDESIEHTADKEYVHELLHKLPEEDAKFIRLKYGFIDYKHRTDREMAILLKQTIADIKKTESRILSDLKELSDLSQINTNIYVDIIVLNWGSNFPNRVPGIWQTKIVQHTALVYKKEMEDLGALCELLSSE